MSEIVFVNELKFPLDQTDYAINLVNSDVNVFIKFQA